ncbi:MAG: polysaccharide biosynthesis protein, partial [Pricia sp.]
MIKEYLVSNAHRYASKWLVLVIDICMVSISFVLSYLIRFNLTLDFEMDKLFIQLPIVALIAAAAFLFTGSNKGVVRHTGVRDVYNIFNAICLSSILLITIVLFNRELGILENFTVPLGIIIIHSLLSFIAMTASRYVFKALYSNLMAQGFKNNKNVLIYGAGE